VKFNVRTLLSYCLLTPFNPVAQELDLARQILTKRLLGKCLIERVYNFLPYHVQ